MFKKTKQKTKKTTEYHYIVIASFCSTVSGWSPVGWDYRINRLHLCRRVRPPPHNEYLGYEIKQSDCEASVMRELCGMWSNP